MKKGRASTFTHDYVRHGTTTLFAALNVADDRLVPVVHETTYEALREVSPLLASRTGLDTAEESMADVAAKLAELVKV
jgi:hypothetical protein